MKNQNIIRGIISHSLLTHGNLGQIGYSEQNGVTFTNLNSSIDIIFRSNMLIYLNTISIISTKTNLQQFRIELLNNEHHSQYTIESSSMTVNLETLPGIVLAGIRLIFHRTNDNQPAKNIVVSIQACIEEILITTTPITPTNLSTTSRINPQTTPITPGRYLL